MARKVLPHYTLLSSPVKFVPSFACLFYLSFPALLCCLALTTSRTGEISASLFG